MNWSNASTPEGRSTGRSQSGGGRGGGREAEVPDRELREAGLGKRIREFDDER